MEVTPPPAPPILPPARAQDNKTALWIAARYGRVAVAELLLAAGAQINHRDIVRVPPPPRASRSLPLSPSPPPRARERERPRRSRAARVSGRAILSASARRRGASPREPPPPRASRPLSLLTMSRARASRVQWGTALYRAAKHGHLDVVRALLNAGADKTIANKSGDRKPIDVACKDAIVALLR